MRKYSKVIICLIAVLFFAGGCAVTGKQEQTAKYPRKPADDPERKAGLPMLFYEAAENDADLNQVIVTPPDAKKQSATE